MVLDVLCPEFQLRDLRFWSKVPDVRYAVFARVEYFELMFTLSHVQSTDNRRFNSKFTYHIPRVIYPDISTP